ncbi:flagellar basal body rod protein FlgC [Aneurinibacillus aneurinilyticus]|uniref:Flagellar basal-body rod protein FlgC n=1 Tax=Aneurinibacillus aneurinilyticus ATCC 12856 TaxID=649747 RepID=U1WKU0_ANEAE|nr:flagellar basal body rod protein FlgC [Aneurinibacillus aneurinilyticus]ERI09204.1 flagellar basal-body rod protein FlgC [Aneurinibacillus aneurinilyticus ATCC 12856]MED0707439.1 flagellar basal body rod protein FlgC [Aneurinibacillus aneurinilyticus]MED0724753.1 flagellar basal body rod protein FlgC [Aneurinibacillus aneurinilyticus]MED0733203.1 flagellar basal body rod protein FlgC [Aneurinibacillus aneurinilyticus]MED0742820.1 flagellar basal body rod protein FlgC [Aneurinibacillus aneur
MALFGSFDSSASALTANRLRLDVISSNISNANTTRGEYVNGRWQPYKRKVAIIEPKKETLSFQNFLQTAANKTGRTVTNGVRVTRIMEDRTEPKRMYDPTHPDADARGYVAFPNVDILKEMVDLMSTIRAYESNVTAINAAKAMATKALEIGK